MYAEVDESVDESTPEERPQYGVGPFSVREVVLAGVWLVAFIVSFFSVASEQAMAQLLFGGSVWTNGLDWILTIGVPTVAVFLIVLRRFSPDGIRRVGSLGIDQFASVAFSVSAVVWLTLLWRNVAVSIETGALDLRMGRLGRVLPHARRRRPHRVRPVHPGLRRGLHRSPGDRRAPQRASDPRRVRSRPASGRARRQRRARPTLLRSPPALTLRRRQSDTYPVPAYGDQSFRRVRPGRAERMGARPDPRHVRTGRGRAEAPVGAPGLLGARHRKSATSSTSAASRSSGSDPPRGPSCSKTAARSSSCATRTAASATCTTSPA